ncbi:endonuclease [Flavobacterium sp.]|uniref:endonuclease n=1 Tax=Flavobacterium sp. TaxID=239 RepID=UPI0008AD9E64|nr:endonuclease [Flavobacterium sp.]OGS62978.1 MAG: ribonuclease [Flavobacteria bacterium GWF1_32_7]HBD25918.1 ribonuclease [Flavobacterium sp.]
MPQKLLTYLFLFLGMFSYSQVVINEIDVDMVSSDVNEIIELKSSTPNFPLDGYVIVLYNETTTASYYAIDLDGYSTDINGIFLAGNTAVSPAPTLVFPNGKIQNGPDVIALYQASSTDFPDGTLVTSTNLANAIAYSTTSALATNLMSALGLSVSTNENVNGLGTTQSIQRKNDGTYEVKAPTPGMPNDGSGIVLNYITVSTLQTSYNEGQSFDIIFTTSQPVTGSDLLFNFTLVNGNFMVNDYTNTNLTVLIPVGQTTASNTCTLFDDITDEGDEELLIDIQSVPTGYVINNDNLILRIYDNDYIVQNFGTPINPTYGLVTPTIPAGYYDSLEGLSGNALKQELQNIIANPSVVRLQSYADMWDIIRIADQNPENSNQIWDMYLEVPMAKIDQQNSSSIVGKWNREHIFPQSRGGFEVANGDTADGISIWNTTGPTSTVDGVSDAHHIRAENGQENSSRNNKNYGTVNSSTVYAGPTVTQGSWHGDVARSLFYMAVRFDGLNVVNGDPSEYLPSTSISSGNIGDLATLLTWNTTDARDDYEMNRNNYVYTWQMNRNPFIDYPNLADYIFGANFGQPWFSTLSTQNPIENRVAVYPNPASEYLIVSGLEGSSKVEIYTITGQLVQSQDFDNEIQINLDLHVGMYLVKVTNGTQSTTKKIIVK